MTDPWAPPDRRPPAAAGRGRRAPEPLPPVRTWGWLTTDVLVVGIAALLVLGAASGLAVTRRSGAHLAAAQTELERELPRLQAFVEQERGLRFTRPVDARVLDDRAFVAELFGGEDEAEETEGDAGATLQALGLLDEDEDLDEAVDDALDSGVVGFYDNESRRLVVRGSEIDPYVETVLVHELTHALQDQVFGLDRPELDDTDDERATGFRSLVEGDATRVEEAYREAQTPQVQREIEREEERRFGGGGETSVVDVLLGFPYFAGQGYVEQVLAEGGQARLDLAFRSPPVTTEQVLEPNSRRLHPVVVATPEGRGDRVDQGVLGAAGLALLLLADPTEPGPHLGWDGDRYATYADDGRTCTTVDVVLEDAAATGRLREALAGWADATGAEIGSRGERGLLLTSCTE